MQRRTKAIWHDERAGLNQCKITYGPKSIKEAKVGGEGGCPASPEGYISCCSGADPGTALTAAAMGDPIIASMQLDCSTFRVQGVNKTGATPALHLPLIQYPSAPQNSHAPGCPDPLVSLIPKSPQSCTLPISRTPYAHFLPKACPKSP